MEDGGKRRRRWAVLAAALSGALLISGIGLWATDSWPFKDRYCWDAWEQDSGPRFLGDYVLRGSGSERRATESGTPGSGGGTATCTLTVTSSDSGSGSSSTSPTGFQDRLTLSYGPVPEAPDERRDWIDRYFDGSASALPDGLDGLVANDRAMLILPESCDVAGRPSAVTLWGESWGDGPKGRRAMPLTLASLPDTSTMLLDAADVGMRKAGCAPEKPLRTSAPMVRLTEGGDRPDNPVCRIPGVTFPLDEDERYEQRVGVVGDRLQTCSLVRRKLGSPDEPAAQFVMAGSPRTAAVFAGLPEGAAHGLVRTACDGRDTVFYARIAPGLGDGGGEKDRRVFERFTEAVGRRVGCEPVKTTGGTDRSEGSEATEGSEGEAR
ncbi:hypothetical protein NW249_28135 [Streptomyces sp. OUCMDZ-4982]|uniref:hypothetical protein n=1 Tax=Streptomyces sp. OUCMDZ-4982 TaxID=2973090 RepID=UPI00215C1350|nr:hypothetical protein [Streptomyces sp. OUCMDZ-4982]MCR8945983.1 hypothetical protein [Streptomyces sp. OUCMDZ-4982]